MRRGKIVAWLFLSYWVAVGIINLFLIRGFGIDGLAELTVLASIGVVCWAVIRFITKKVGDLVTRSRKKLRRRERFMWQ